MANSASSNPATKERLGEAVSAYLTALPGRDRDAQAPALQRFVRWLGADRELNAIRPIDLELYQEQIGDGGIDPSRSLEGVRSFLGEAKKRRWTETNLSVHIKIRRKATRASASAVTNEPEQRVQMTEAGREVLQRELQELEAVTRPGLTQAVQSAREDGDLRENAPYHAARQQLAEVQSRIDKLKGQLQAATIVQTGQTERVGLGTRVVLTDLDHDEEINYTLVGPGEVDARNHKISIQSPVGRALVDHAAGETVEVQTPAGAMRLRIDRIEAAV
jgi:transcription elongation factor GreA